MVLIDECSVHSELVMARPITFLQIKNKESMNEIKNDLNILLHCNVIMTSRVSDTPLWYISCLQNIPKYHIGIRCCLVQFYIIIPKCLLLMYSS